MRVDVYGEFIELLKASKPKSGELVYAAQRSEKDGSLLLITSASLEVPPEAEEGKKETYDFVLTYNSWFADDEVLRQSGELLALLKEKKGRPVKPEEMARRRRVRNLAKRENQKKAKKLREAKKKSGKK